MDLVSSRVVAALLTKTRSLTNDFFKGGFGRPFVFEKGVYFRGLSVQCPVRHSFSEI